MDVPGCFCFLEGDSLDIKTRNVIRGTIKTLDRTGSSMHHLKEETIRSKAAEAGNRYDNESAGSYAPAEIEHFAGDGAAYAARAGVDMMLRSREHAAYSAEHLSEADVADIQSGHFSPKTANAVSENSEQISQAFRERGMKTIRDRQREAKMADKEVLRNTEKEKLGIHIGRVSASENKQNNERTAARIPGIRRKSLQDEKLKQRRRKEYAIKRITERNAKSGALWRSITGSRNSHPDKTVKRSGRLLKGAADGTRTFLSTLSVGGIAVVIVIIIMILFGAALAMNEDGSYMTGSGDATIVEVARGELGNVGGDKFWKWYGFKSHVHWCACFVSWCANQCGYIETGIIPKFAVVGDGASWFKARHRWACRGYKPKPGDIIFFDFEQDGLLDHVGLVETCDGKTVTTIEGNSGNACKRQYYRVGSSQIAGYGLVLILGGGNKSQMIARKATQLAYPDSPKESRYHGGKPTPAYKAALERAYPHRGSWGKPSRDGASCDVFVGVCIVDSGVDKDFPRGYRDQAIRLDKRKDLYDCVISTTSRDIKVSELKDGDIIRYDKSNGGVHIMIYVGGKIKQAGHDNFYPRTNSPGSKLKIRGKKLIRVYRAKG